MDKERYFAEVKSQYHLICISIKNGKGVTDLEKGRLEGFMRAAVTLGVATNQELQQVLEGVHFKIFGMSIAERKSAQDSNFPDDAIDYGQFDRPAIERVGQTKPTS